MPFVKKLARLGNSSAVVLDKPFMKQLDLDANSEVEISIESDAICIRAHRYASDADVKGAAEKILRDRKRLMQRLAK
jgi:antitoxin component of MazEF toxin-antitoxin module